MAKRKRSVNVSKAEFLFEEDGVKVIEHLRESDREYELLDLIKDFEGCTNLTISISTEKEI